jgi:hypothetical protein
MKRTQAELANIFNAGGIIIEQDDYYIDNTNNTYTLLEYTSSAVSSSMLLEKLKPGTDLNNYNKSYIIMDTFYNNIDTSLLGMDVSIRYNFSGSAIGVYTNQQNAEVVLSWDKYGEILSMFPDVTMSFDWGDGNISRIPMTGSYTETHSYANPHNYNVMITNSPIAIFDGLTINEILTINDNTILSYVGGSLKYDKLPDISNKNNLMIVNFGYNDIDTVPVLPKSLIFVVFTQNKLTSAGINDLLHQCLDMPNLVSVYANDQSTPAPPTGQGIIDAQTLEDRGVDVKTD